MDDVTKPFGPPGPRQFRLKSLFAVTTAVAVMFATGRWFGPTIALFVSFMGLASAGICLVPGSRAEKLGRALIVAVLSPFVLLIVITLLPDGIFSFAAREGCTRRSACNNNLRQIGLGLQIYADVYGSLPPAYIADDGGRPMHSWRVLILPFIEEKELYKQYDFNESWDGPHNRQLAGHMPPCYRCPSDAPWPSVNTSYLALTGEETVWPGTDSIAWSQVCDGTPNTLAVVEMAGSGINWMEPRDLSLSAFCGSPPTGLKTLGAHPSETAPNGAMAVFCDGHTSYLQISTPAITLRALATRAGGETIVGDY